MKNGKIIAILGLFSGLAIQVSGAAPVFGPSAQSYDSRTISVAKGLTDIYLMDSKGVKYPCTNIGNLTNQLGAMTSGQSISARFNNYRVDFFLNKNYGGYGAAYIDFEEASLPADLYINREKVATIASGYADTYSKGEGDLAFILQNNF